MKNKIIVSAITFLLSACKVGVDASVPLTGVLSDGIKETNASLYVEVASCTDYEDSRQPSHSLLEAQKSVPAVFAGADFKECFTKKMDSWAEFSIPITYGRFAKGEVKDDGKLHILSFDDIQGQSLAFDASESLKSKINNISKDRFGNFNPSDLTIRINVNNDTGSDKKIDVVSSFVNEQPVVYIGDSVLKKDQNITLRLSDVTTQAVLLPASYGQLPNFLRNVH